MSPSRNPYNATRPLLVKAMEMVLTGGMMSAKEAETAGLVARVVPNDQVHTAHAAVHFTHNSGV